MAVKTEKINCGMVWFPFGSTAFLQDYDLNLTAPYFSSYITYFV